MDIKGAYRLAWSLLRYENLAEEEWLDDYFHRRYPRGITPVVADYSQALNELPWLPVAAARQSIAMGNLEEPLQDAYATCDGKPTRVGRYFTRLIEKRKPPPQVLHFLNDNQYEKVKHLLE